MILHWPAAWLQITVQLPQSPGDADELLLILDEGEMTDEREDEELDDLDDDEFDELEDRDELDMDEDGSLELLNAEDSPELLEGGIVELLVDEGRSLLDDELGEMLCDDELLGGTLLEEWLDGEGGGDEADDGGDGGVQNRVGLMGAVNGIPA